MRLRTKIAGGLFGTFVATCAAFWTWLMIEPKPKKKDSDETTALLGVVFPKEKP